MTVDRSDWKQVPLPNRVQVDVSELARLRRDSAMLAALRQAKVEEWHGYAFAQWLEANDPSIKDIALGDAQRRSGGDRGVA